jgi:hypothetical protein
MPKQLGDIAWPVSTARLTLRLAWADDAETVLSYRRTPSVAEWIGEPPEDFPARFAAPERLDLLLMVERAGDWRRQHREVMSIHTRWEGML